MLSWNLIKNDATFSRQDILQIIAYLVLHAAPSSDRSIRRRRYARGLVLWATLLKMIPDYEGKAMELASRRWPVSLHQRFASALRYRTQRPWPHTPYRGTKNFCTRFKYSATAAIVIWRAHARLVATLQRRVPLVRTPLQLFGIDLRPPIDSLV